MPAQPAHIGSSRPPIRWLRIAANTESAAQSAGIPKPCTIQRKNACTATSTARTAAVLMSTIAPHTMSLRLERAPVPPSLFIGGEPSQVAGAEEQRLASGLSRLAFGRAVKFEELAFITDRYTLLRR